jgi:hypothetical protein
MPYGWKVFGDAAVLLGCGVDRDSIYGNIFMNLYHHWPLQWIMNCGSPVTYGGQYFANNTFYNCYGYVFTGNPAISHECPDSTFYLKYNVAKETFHASGYWLQSNTAGPLEDSSKCEVDSNYWYDAAGVNFTFYDGTSRNWSYWTTDLAYDGGGDTTAVTFDSVGAVDPWLGFKRSGAGTEMNHTYGGRTWTQFGAVQNDAEASGPSKAPFRR